jgi:hypothetical protein
MTVPQTYSFVSKPNSDSIGSTSIDETTIEEIIVPPKFVRVHS